MMMVVVVVVVVMMMMMMMLTSWSIGCHGEDDVARGLLCVCFELLDVRF